MRPETTGRRRQKAGRWSHLAQWRNMVTLSICAARRLSASRAAFWTVELLSQQTSLVRLHTKVSSSYVSNQFNFICHGSNLPWLLTYCQWLQSSMTHYAKSKHVTATHKDAQRNTSYTHNQFTFGLHWSLHVNDVRSLYSRGVTKEYCAKACPGVYATWCNRMNGALCNEELRNIIMTWCNRMNGALCNEELRNIIMTWCNRMNGALCNEELRNIIMTWCNRMNGALCNEELRNIIMTWCNRINGALCNEELRNIIMDVTGWTGHCVTRSCAI
jgi:hypothetical protein